MRHDYLHYLVIHAFKGLGDGRQSSQDIGQRGLRMIDDRITRHEGPLGDLLRHAQAYANDRRVDYSSQHSRMRSSLNVFSHPPW
jgi:hypothetical protein